MCSGGVGSIRAFAAECCFLANSSTGCDNVTEGCHSCLTRACSLGNAAMGSAFCASMCTNVCGGISAFNVPRSGFISLAATRRLRRVYGRVDRVNTTGVAMECGG